MNLSDKTAMIFDNGLFQPLSHRLARDFGRVLYHRGTRHAFPSPNDSAIGAGYERVERADSWEAHIDEVDLFCYDDQTEILSENGWKLFKDLTRDERVATKNPSTGFLEYHKPLEHIAYHYSGDLMAIESCRVNFAVTPNHRMVVRKQRQKMFDLVPAKDVFGRSQLEFSKEAKWAGNTLVNTVIPECSVRWVCGRGKFERVKTWKEIEVKSDLLLAIAGFYLAEGSLERRHGDHVCGVHIGQNPGDTWDKFISILKESGLPFTVKRRKSGFLVAVIHSTQVARFFRDNFGECIEKKVPAWVKDSSPQSIAVLFDWYMKGDGAGTGATFSTISRTLANDLQELVLKLGWSASEKQIKSVSFKAPNGKKYVSRSGYRINVSRKYLTPVIQKGSQWKKIPYDGMVYCVAVPNHVIYVRRKGVPIWCGNCFPDLYWADTQAYLRSIGHRVFGCGWGEELELWRDDFYSTLKRNGLNTVPWEMVHGMTALREYLGDEEDRYVKVSYHRGLMETFKWIDMRISKPRLDVLQHDLGALSEDQWFLVQDSLDSKREVGSDQIIVDGKFPLTVQYAVEGKDKTGLARMLPYARLPREVQDVNDKLDQVFASVDKEHLLSNPYRGFFSTEIRVAKDGKPYLTDPTCRMASPCGETYMLMSENFSEMIWAAAEGQIVEPVVKKPFAAQAMIQADLAETQSIPIFIDPKVRDQVCLFHSGIREDGQECVFKSDAALLEIGSVIGLGATLDAAIEDCRAVASKVECDKMTIATDQLEQYKKDLLA